MLHMISSPELEHEAMHHMLGQHDRQLDYWRSSLALTAGGLQPAASGYAHKQGCAIECDWIAFTERRTWSRRQHERFRGPGLTAQRCVSRK